MKEPNFAAVYCCIYPELATIARKHGYALAIHGSMANDFDITAIPWADVVSKPQVIVDEITNTFGIKEITEWKTMNHGRVAKTLDISFGTCRLDLSFMPANNYLPTN